MGNSTTHVLDFGLGRIMFGLIILLIGITMPYITKIIMIYSIAGSSDPLLHYMDVIFDIEMPLTFWGCFWDVLGNFIFVALNIVPYVVIALLVVLDTHLIISVKQYLYRMTHNLFKNYSSLDDKQTYFQVKLSDSDVVTMHFMAILPALASVVYVNLYFHLAGMVWFIDKYSHLSSTTPLVYAVFPLYGAWAGLIVYILAFGLMVICRIDLGRTTKL